MFLKDIFKTCNDDNIYTLDVDKGQNYSLPLLHFARFEQLDFVNHCFTTRLGGASKGIFESLNLSSNRGDEKEAVLENYRRIAVAMGIKEEDMVFSDQTHTTNVRVITEKDAGNGMTRPNEFKDVDGMVTNVPGLMLGTFYADCVPLYIVDPVNKAIGLSHSGWKGTVGRIGKATLDTMAREYGTRPEQAICAIGPSICCQCYEVSEDVALQFAEAFKSNKDNIVKPSSYGIEGKYQLDLWEACNTVFAEAGVKEENIIKGNICTCCNSRVMFSHRASQGKRGNLGAFLGIRP